MANLLREDVCRMIYTPVREMTIADLGPATAENYRRSLRLVQEAKERAPEEEKRTLAGMISDCEFSLVWIETGHRPPPKRDVDRVRVEQRTALWDPDWFETFKKPVDNPNDGPRALTEEQKWKLGNVLSLLTERELQVYVMKVGYLLPMQKIADELGITKSTVQSALKKAEKKLR